EVTVIAGDGGNGKLSFRHEKFIDKGGPDGGDGGNGGDVVLVASRNETTLAAFRYQKELKATDGEPGGKQRMHGKSAGDLEVSVPVGTVVMDEAGKVLADLTHDEQKAVIAHGGRGGYGNAHFVSSTRQAPKFAEKGEPGDSLQVKLELKMIADVGLVGLPNAGKSTLLSRLSNAKPEIADYPFTTLTPNLGVVDIDTDTSVLIADIPGLIEGANEGKGLGHEFLRHVERTSVLIHLIDAYQPDVPEAYRTIRTELEKHDPQLAKRAEIVALNKIDGLDAEIVDDLLTQLRAATGPKAQLLAVSAQSGQGIRELLYAVKAAVLKARTKQAKQAEKSAVPVLTLGDQSRRWQVRKEGATFVVSGPRIEKFAQRTDFSNEQGLRRLRDIMNKMGVMHELNRRGIKAGATIRIHGAGTFEY
ncbi:MAG TPA: GTPase ObgE, partial [Candidatus Saccharimonadales bacterium]|nr:GTPase ObgE [Candidatus Saccharimonadales bacterium]